MLQPKTIHNSSFFNAMNTFEQRHINYGHLSGQSTDYLIELIKELDKKLHEALEEKKDLETLLENLTEHSDNVTDELFTEQEDLQLLIETTSEHADAIADDLEQKKELIRQTFGRYLSDEIVNTLLDDEDGLKLGGTREEITILTSDLRGFTTLSEKQEPENVVRILNFYLDKMEKIITKYLGTIDEFMGDGILVLFGAPTKRDDDVKRAVACAIEMQLSMAEINLTMEDWGFPCLEMGIGINTGEVVVGNIGSENRTKYGVVGSSVNLTYRIESYTLGGQILVSQSTYDKVQNTIDCYEELKVSPKGVKAPITIHSIKAIHEPYNLSLRTEENHLEVLDKAIEVSYILLAGKHMGEDKMTARITHLSEKYAYLALSEETMPPDVYSNLKIDCKMMNESAYCKVVDACTCKLVKTEAEKGFFVCFTSNTKIIK